MTSSVAGGSNYILLTHFFECPLTESMEYATCLIGEKHLAYFMFQAKVIFSQDTCSLVQWV